MKGQTTIIILAVLFVSLVFIAFMYTDSPISYEGGIKRFSSYSELENFVKAGEESSSVYGTLAAPMAVTRQTVGMETTASSDAGKAESTGTSGGSDYSETNIQVAGVDEADIVKNDGKYIYTVSGNKVVIVDAYPADVAEIVSEIEFDGYPNEIFINGDRLVVMGWEYYYSSGVSIPEIGITAPRYDTTRTFVKVYDITDRAKPVLMRNVSVDGNYYDSRMIGDHVYVISNQYIYYGGGAIPMPTVRTGTSVKTVAASEIYYFDYPDTSYTFTNIVSVNVNNDAEEATSKTFLLGYAQNMYVSQSNIYIVYTKRLREVDYYDRLIDEAVIPNVPYNVQMEISEVRNSNKDDYEKMQDIGEVIQDYIETLTPEQGAIFMKDLEEDVQIVYQDISKELEKTIVHKISINAGSIDYVTSGEVPGYTLNQFSMDESNGYFRIATTTNNWRTESLNHVYVLDANLNIVGKLEDLAHGETIHSVRFIGNKGYMVTFRQIDPLFVIDLSNPASPQVLGYLKIPGVSDYLHPYDETHLIGVGRDATEKGIVTGMKLSLFDVSDVSNPTEISKYIIGERGTYSEALYDHKAFLFDKDKELLVIPVREYGDNYKETYQGAYVFNVDLENGFVLKGTVTHVNETAKEEDEWYYEWNAEVRRSLYIDNILYTLSNKMIKANSLADLAEISKVELPYESDYGYVRGMAVGGVVEDVAVEAVEE